MTELSKLAGWQRPLLPGELLEAPGGKRSARDWVVDVVLFVAAMVIGVLSLNEATPDHSDVGVIVDFLVGTAVCALLWVRRRYPVGVAVIAAVAAAFS